MNHNARPTVMPLRRNMGEARSQSRQKAQLLRVDGAMDGKTGVVESMTRAREAMHESVRRTLGKNTGKPPNH